MFKLFYVHNYYGITRVKRRGCMQVVTEALALTHVKMTDFTGVYIFKNISTMLCSLVTCVKSDSAIYYTYESVMLIY